VIDTLSMVTYSYNKKGFLSELTVWKYSVESPYGTYYYKDQYVFGDTIIWIDYTANKFLDSCRGCLPHPIGKVKTKRTNHAVIFLESIHNNNYRIVHQFLSLDTSKDIDRVDFFYFNQDSILIGKSSYKCIETGDTSLFQYQGETFILQDSSKCETRFMFFRKMYKVKFTQVFPAHRRTYTEEYYDLTSRSIIPDRYMRVFDPIEFFIKDQKIVYIEYKTPN
jgi:hypothetical protein